MSDDSIDGLRDAAEIAVTACLPLLPLRGSWGSGYTLEEKISGTLVATPEEWAEAAHAIAALHNAITHKPLEPPADDDESGIFDIGPTVGYCSKCGEAREEFYTCRDDGETVPRGQAPGGPQVDDD